MNKTTPLQNIATLFFRLGATAFGGPAAHIAMMQNEVVHRRRWLTEQEFLDLVSACNLIPGPNSTEMAIHIGRKQAGWRGMLVAGITFILPAATIVIALAWAYIRYSQIPVVTNVMNGIKPMIIAIILQALLALSNSALKNSFLKFLSIAIFIACFFCQNELLLLLIGGMVSLLWLCGKPEAIGNRIKIFCTCGLMALLATASIMMNSGSYHLPVEPTASFDLNQLFWYFMKVGSVLYGSGYVLLAFLRSDLVEQAHWLTSAQLLDATAVGQITPGPVFTTATFIGFVLGNFSGAIVATIGIFLPAFLFVAATAPFIDKLRSSKVAGATLDGVNVSSLALMAFVSFELGKVSLTQPIFIAETIVAIYLLWKHKINPTWLILTGAAIGAFAG